MPSFCQLAAAALLGTTTAVLSVGPVSAATDQERREALRALYRVMITNEHCDFEMSEKEAEAVSDAAEALVRTLKLNEEQANKLYSQIDQEMDKQGWEKLCDPKGDWAKTCRQTVQSASKK